jgi:hypothetical protein
LRWLFGSPDAAAHFLFSMKSKLFMNFVSDDAMPIEEHRNEVHGAAAKFFLSQPNT